MSDGHDHGSDGHGQGHDHEVDLGIEGLEHAVEVGFGGFATVYRADQPAFGRTVAVKLLNTSLDESSRARFERECQTMGALSEHPNIVTVHGGGFTRSRRPYLLMGFLHHGSLADRVNQGGPIPWDEASLIGIHLAGALETAHRAGIIHRDIKPENVLVSNFGEPQLGDFGIARVAGTALTRSGEITGSVEHLPPEVIEGQAPTVRSDVYSLASTLYELLRGTAAFTVEGEESFVPALRRVLVDPPPDLRPLGIPDPIVAVIEQAMAKDPAARPASALDLGRMLQSARHALGLDPGRIVVPGEDPLLAPGAAAAPRPPSSTTVTSGTATTPAEGSTTGAALPSPVPSPVPPPAPPATPIPPVPPIPPVTPGAPPPFAPAVAPAVPAASTGWVRPMFVLVAILLVLFVAAGAFGQARLRSTESETAAVPTSSTNPSPPTSDEPGASGPTTTGPSPAPAPPATTQSSAELARVDLRITISARDLPELMGATLHCDGERSSATGYLADDPATPCVSVVQSANRERLTATEPQTTTGCTANDNVLHVTARVTGTIGGSAVDTTFDRETSCAIADWEEMAPALPTVAQTNDAVRRRRGG